MASDSRLEIRQVRGEELRQAFFPLWAYSFLSSREPPSRYDEIYEEMATSREERIIPWSDLRVIERSPASNPS